MITLNGNNITRNGNVGVLANYSNAVLDLFNNKIKNNGLAFYINGSNNIFGNINRSEWFNEVSDNDNGVLINGNNNTISNLDTINNQYSGFIVNGSNNSILSCNIVNNGLNGLNITGNNNTINYNRIYKNSIGMVNNGNNTNGNLNWRGINDISNQYENHGSNLSLENWFIASLYLDNNKIKEKLKVLYTFTLNDPNTTVNNSLLPYFTANINTSHSIKFIDGRFSNNLTETITKSGNFSALSITDDQINKLFYNVSSAINPDPVIPIPDPIIPVPIDNNPNSKNSNVKAGMKSTGNPIAMLVISLISISIIGIRKRY